MKAKLIENISFQQKRDPKKALGLGIHDTLSSVYLSYDEMESLINDPILDNVFSNNPHTGTDEIKKAIHKMVDEIIDTWETSTMED